MVIGVRSDPGARIYTLNNFLSEYSPVSGNYGPIKPYLGSDSLKSSPYSVADKVKSMYSSAVSKIKDSYRSIKDGLPKTSYELSFSYR
jgi:hypothetical protein